MTAQRYGLSEQDIQSIQAVFRKFPNVAEAILYGSRAKGSYRHGSDIDLTLKGNQLTHDNLLDIEIALDDLLLPYKFDLSLHQHLDNAELLSHIARVGKLFYKAPE